MSEEAALPWRRIEAVAPGIAPREGYEACVIGSAVDLDPRQMVSYCSGKWEPLIYDALLVSAVAEYCDRICKRPARGWGRRFDVVAPVNDPARCGVLAKMWQQHAVHRLLTHRNTILRL